MSDTVQDSAPTDDKITETGEPVKRGRGRPPGAKNGTGMGADKGIPAAQQRKANEATETMQGYYEFLSMILEPVAPAAALLFKQGMPAAQRRNRQAFLASPKLAARISATGGKTGTFGFIVAQVVLVAPVAIMVSAETGISFKSKPKPEPKKPATKPRTDPATGMFVPQFDDKAEESGNVNPVMPIFGGIPVGDPSIRAEQ